MNQDQQTFETLAKADYPEIELSKTDSGRYKNTVTQAKWEGFQMGWQAGREDAFDAVRDLQ